MNKPVSRLSPRFLPVFMWAAAALLFVVVAVACGATTESTPTPEPTTAPNATMAPTATTEADTADNGLPDPAGTADAGDMGDGSGECSVGLKLNPGEGCSYEDFSILIREDGAAVLDGNIGGITMGNTVMDGQSINLNRFRAVKSGSTWTIESLP